MSVTYRLAFERDLAQADLFTRSFAPAAAPPSGTVLAVVRQFGEAEEREDGLTVYRLSAARLADRDVIAMLGTELERARDIALLWDDREEELVRVIDEADLRPAMRTQSYADLKVRGDRRPRHAGYARAA